jgi:hypothetical protein
LGVAVTLAIRLANDGVLESFKNSLDHVAGKSRLRVSAGEAGFDETLFPRIAATPGIAKAVPVVQAVTPGEVSGGGATQRLKAREGESALDLALIAEKSPVSTPRTA